MDSGPLEVAAASEPVDSGAVGGSDVGDGAACVVYDVRDCGVGGEV